MISFLNAPLIQLIMEARHSITGEHFEKAKTICAQVLRNNWSNSDAIETSVLSGGYVSYLILCSLKDEYCDERSKPHKVSATEASQVTT